jgi:thiamine kinase-like enzyme
VARLAGDRPELGVVRSLELAAHRAADAEGLAPAIRHAESDILVTDYVPGRIPNADELAAPDMLARVLTVLRRCHRGAMAHYRGTAIARWPFRTIRDYGARLTESAAGVPGNVADWLGLAKRLEFLAGAMQPTLIHADPTAGNWIDDGERLWLIDWEYAGFADPLVDLAALAADGGDRLDADRLLHGYADVRPDADLKRRFAALTAAVILRNAMWYALAAGRGGAAIDFGALARRDIARFEDACRSLGL